MKDYSIKNIRNVAIIGHGSCGKTSLTSAFLFNSGAVNRLTQVDKGNTVTDYDPDEKERQISINSALCHLEWNNNKNKHSGLPRVYKFSVGHSLQFEGS